MAAAKPMSPGGAILRSSRMFSLPQQISAPMNVATSNLQRSSSATTPFPTLQSVTTPSAARIRGDWGFKRPFPLKSTTKTSTPLIRVKQVDSSEQVSDFASASDHTLSLQKFHEMNIPVVIPTPSPGNQPFSAFTTGPIKSVFEEEFDFTDYDPAQARLMRDKRWKFSGPWLSGMAEGQFQRYLKRRVTPRRAEFRQWLKGEIASEINIKAAARATELGEPAPPTVTAEDIGSAEITEKLRRLRDDRHELFRIVGDFLDLAPIRQTRLTDRFEAFRSGQAITRPPTANPYAAEGPPITHPSAGISYIRTNAFVENHPIYGPQAHHRHVKARQLMAPKGILTNQPIGRLGVGGFVTDSPGGDYQSTNKANKEPRFDPSIEGGRKVYVEPRLAVIDTKGSVRISVSQTIPMAAFVARQLDGEKLFTPPQPPARTQTRSSRIKKVGGASQTTGSSEAYGLGDLGDFEAYTDPALQPKEPAL